MNCNGKFSLIICSKNLTPDTKFIVWESCGQLFAFLCVPQNRLKSSQREKVRQFVALTETNESTAIRCLSQHDWRLDVASDSYFQYPERYYCETKGTIDKKKIAHLFDRYRGKKLYSDAEFVWDEFEWCHCTLFSHSLIYWFSQERIIQLCSNYIIAGIW